MNPPNKSKDAKLGGLAAEDVGTQVATRDGLLGDVLERRPVLSFDAGLLLHPVRDELLADTPRCVSAQEFRQTIRKGRLSADDGNRALKRNNVVWFHEHELYKQACTQVNKHTRMTSDKSPCRVVAMPAVRRKPPKAKAEKSLRRGADGRTANERFREAFGDWQGVGGEKTQPALVRACNVIAGRPPNPEKDFVSQQIIDQIKRDEIDASRSSFLDVLAEALDVRAVWLRLGVGLKKPDRAVIDRLRTLLQAGT